MYEKFGIDADRLEFLKAELKRTEQEIQLCEAQRYSWIYSYKRHSYLTFRARKIHF